ncbi:MAG: acyltransferase [Deltaproteobacteria bacterium]|nr:acyltransferase [Deltaproteobacteria bacterium]
MKRVFKSLLSAMFRVLSLPAFGLYLSQAYIVGDRRAFGAVMQFASLWPGITGEWFRRGVLQWVTGCSLKDCCISFGTTFSDPRVRIDDGVYLGTRCDIGWAEIGRDCVIGSGVHIMSGSRQHFFDDPDVPIRDQGGVFRKIGIGRDTWIGNGSLIAADVGVGCVIGAGSVVVSAVPDYAVAVGSPCRVVRFRSFGDGGS